MKQSYVILAIIFALLSSVTHAHHFRYNADVITDDGESVLRVNSTGRTRNIIDLDNEKVVKRILCDGRVLTLALVDSIRTQQWSPGDIVVGRPRENCFLQDSYQGKSGMLLNLKSVRIVQDRIVELTTSLASVKDIIEEGDIKLFYDKRASRQKRDLSGFLSKPLNSIHWMEKDLKDTVSFNPERIAFGIEKRSTRDLPNSFTGAPGPEAEREFLFICDSCLGNTDFAYGLDLKIKKTMDNKPDLKTFISSLNGIDQHRLTMSVAATKPVSVSFNATVLKYVHPADTIPLVELDHTFGDSKHMNLSFEVSTEVVVSVAVVTNGPVNIKFDTSSTGRYSIVQTASNTTVNPANWTSVPATDNSVSNDMPYSIGVSITHKIVVQPKLEWTKKDIQIDFLSAFEFDMMYKFASSSVTNVTSMCTTSNVGVEADFKIEDSRFKAKAFQFPIWDSVLAQNSDNVRQLASTELYKRCRANCNVKSPSPVTKLESVCGNASTPITRKSSDFSDLKELFGDMIVFPSEETAESTWCGEPGNPCTNCSDESNVDNICSDRLVSADMANALTKLGKFVLAEWNTEENTKKLVVQEGWDEPTSTHPLGRYGSVSLFYEGKAARIGVSLLASSAILDNNIAVYNRLKELATCANLAFIEKSQGLIDVCVKEQVNRRRRRSSDKGAVNVVEKINRDEVTNQLLQIVPQMKKEKNTVLVFSSGQTAFPMNKNPETELCGEWDGKFSIENSDQMARLYEYPLDDVFFEPEGPSYTSCGTSTRRCKQCETYSFSNKPIDWCTTRTMVPRMAARIRRLNKLISIEEEMSRRKKRSVSNEEAACLEHLYPLTTTTKQYNKCRESMVKIGKSSDEAKSLCKQCVKRSACCYVKKCREDQCILDTSVKFNYLDGPNYLARDALSCTAKKMYNDNEDGKDCQLDPNGDIINARLYDNKCTGDPCMFFSGEEYFKLMKILMIWESCSGKMKTTYNNGESIINERVTKEKTILDFRQECKSPGDLKVHYPKKGDPTIGIGFSLQTADRKENFEKMMGMKASDIISGGKSISDKQAVFLFAEVLPSYTRNFQSAIRNKDLAKLPVKAKIAAVVFSFRGDFGYIDKPKFKKAIEAEDYAGAKHIILQSKEYNRAVNNCLKKSNRNGICSRIEWVADAFGEIQKPKIKIPTKRNKRKKRSSSSTSDSWFEKLSNNGRALRIQLNTGTSLKTTWFANLAVKAGFDYVEIEDTTTLKVCVRNQKGPMTHITSFPNVNLIDVNPPPGEITEYTITKGERFIPLLDGHNETLVLSKCYKVKDVKSPGHRYFRFDPTLIECLEEASEEYESCIPIIAGSGYRVKSLNERNIDSRHNEEKDRFNAGQAVELKLPKSQAGSDLSKLAISIIRTCTVILRPKQMKIGIGCHSDRVYLDVRQSDDSSDILDVWNVSNKTLYSELVDVKDSLLKGGPFIDLKNSKRKCKTPPLGTDAFYIKSTNKEDSCVNTDDDCSLTKASRSKEVDELATKLSVAAGSGQLKKGVVKPLVKQCFEDNCGGCVGKGSVWFKKTKACLNLIKKFISEASRPFPANLHNNVAFFKMEDSESVMHSEACHHNRVCVENTQIYSLLMATLNAKFRSDPASSTEEKVFDPAKNPSPVISLLEQELAMEATGEVKVFVREENDLSSLHHILKILMVYNRNVDIVKFFVGGTKSSEQEAVVKFIQSKIERWASSVCPNTSRLMIAPYEVVELSSYRVRRSAKLSRERNDRMLQMRNWELEWLMKN